MNTWGILCPGPSLGRYEVGKQIDEDRADLLVAVNGAVLEWFDVHYWAVCDVEVFDTCLKNGVLLAKRPVLWCPERWRTELVDLPPLLDAFASWFEKEYFPTETNDAFRAALHLPFRPDINWRESTFLIAIGMAVARGAQKIFIYGADLAGKGYCRKGLENCRTVHTDDRWAREARQLEIIIQNAAEHNIAIIHRRQKARG